MPVSSYNDHRDTLIIAGGSPSSICATALYCKANGITHGQIRNGNVRVVFTQAFQVGEGSETLGAVRALHEHGKVVIIGIGVNNRDPQMTVNLIREIGDRLVGVYDEHEPERWEALREKLGLSADKFHCEDREDTLSAASVVVKAFEAKFTGREPLLQAGDWLDNRHMEVSFDAKELGMAIDTATKVDIGDNKFRVSALLHLLKDGEATTAFEARLEQGKVIEAATQAAIAAGGKQGNCFVFHHEGDINVTAAMMAGYRTGAAFAVAVGGKAGEGEVVSVGVNNRHTTLGKTDVLAVLSQAGYTASGFASKATVHGTENLDAMLEVLNGLEG